MRREFGFSDNMKFLPAEFQLMKGDSVNLAASPVISCGFVVCSFVV
jgi:hypothetical protein